MEWQALEERHRALNSRWQFINTGTSTCRYINISGTFYYLCGVLDGCSLHRELGSAGVDDRGGHRDHLVARPGISPGGVPPDNLRQRPRFIAKDCKEFIRISGMTHARTSPYYPQSNGKIERWHKSLNGECIRLRLNSAIGYIAPKDMLSGRQQEIHAGRDRKLVEARKQRQIRGQQAA